MINLDINKLSFDELKKLKASIDTLYAEKMKERGKQKTERRKARQHQSVKMYFQKNKTLAEIADHFGVATTTSRYDISKFFDTIWWKYRGADTDYETALRDIRWTKLPEIDSEQKKLILKILREYKPSNTL